MGLQYYRRKHKILMHSLKCAAEFETAKDNGKHNCVFSYNSEGKVIFFLRFLVCSRVECGNFF